MVTTAGPYIRTTSDTRRRMRSSIKLLLALLLVIIGLVVVLSVVLVATSFTFRVEGDAMLPAFADGDRLLVNNALLSQEKPRRGDIIVFKASTEPRDFIKRVIAVEGETVEVRPEPGLENPLQADCDTCCNACDVYVNGVKLDEPYIHERPSYKRASIVVPQDHVYVLGDNRRNSSDSHIWGPLPVDAIRGKVVLRFEPFRFITNPAYPEVGR